VAAYTGVEWFRNRGKDQYKTFWGKRKKKELRVHYRYVNIDSVVYPGPLKTTALELKENEPPAWRLQMKADMEEHNRSLEPDYEILPMSIDVADYDITEDTMLPLTPFPLRWTEDQIAEKFKLYKREAMQYFQTRKNKVSEACMEEKERDIYIHKIVELQGLFLEWFVLVANGDIYCTANPAVDGDHPYPLAEPDRLYLGETTCGCGILWTFDDNVTNLWHYHTPQECITSFENQQQTLPQFLWRKMPKFIHRAITRIEVALIPEKWKYAHRVYNSTKNVIRKTYNSVTFKVTSTITHLYYNYWVARPEMVASALLIVVLALTMKFRHKLSQSQSDLVRKLKKLLERVQNKEDVTEEELDKVNVEMTKTKAGKKSIGEKDATDTSDFLRLILAIGGLATMYSVNLKPLQLAASGIVHVNRLLSIAEKDKDENRNFLSEHFGRNATKYRLFFITLAVLVALAKTIPMIHDYFFGDEYQPRYRNTEGRLKKGIANPIMAAKYARPKPSQKGTLIAKKKAAGRNKLAHGISAFWDEYQHSSSRRNEDDDGQYGLSDDWDREEFIDNLIENGGWWSANNKWLDLDYFAGFHSEWYDPDQDYLQDDFDLDNYTGDKRWQQEEEMDAHSAQRWGAGNKSNPGPEKDDVKDGPTLQASRFQQSIEAQRILDNNEFIETAKDIPEDVVKHLQTITERSNILEVGALLDTAKLKSTEMEIKKTSIELPTLVNCEEKHEIITPVTIAEFRLSKEQIPAHVYDRPARTLVQLVCKNSKGQRKKIQIGQLNDHYATCKECWQKATGSTVPKATKHAITGSLLSSVGVLTDPEGETVKSAFIYNGGVATCKHKGTQDRKIASFRSGNMNIYINESEDTPKDHGRADFTFYDPQNTTGMPKSLKRATALPTTLSPITILAAGTRKEVTLIIGHIGAIELADGEAYYWASMCGDDHLQDGDSGSPVIDVNGKVIGVFCAYNSQKRIAMITPIPAAESLAKHTKKQ